MAGYIMTIDQALDAALAGGFAYNHGIIYIVAIGWAESRWKTDARNLNTNGTTDRGWLQINSIHTDISDADCDDPVKAATYAYNNLSAQGTSFSAWSAYNSGAYKGPDGITWTAVSKAFESRQKSGQITNLQNQISSLQTQIANLQGQVDSDKTQITNLSQSLASANAQVTQLQTSLSSCQSSNASKDATISSLNTKINNARNDLA